ncbi:acetylgalactosaminyl-proteoglycan 3-beta-glucuronosyltransferase [Gallibacterium anatis]|uniref:glycosyltransferase family 2 protein n=1 Tax=Gallibacterium anatis TaxID=750 RepID=UPI000530C9B6|nr:glycosyltransferase [Gallibacterium anatis]KGQ27199.1 acetylgalactosaminyl-proteoglycan 3-beta-glucuronosyltransferase [Gallibacterium anatis]
MNILSQAIAYFNSGDYQKALELFIQASNIYSKNTVAYHIKKCEEKLNIIDSRKDPTSIFISKADRERGELDIATKILLSNMGKFQLEEEEKSLIQQWKKLTSRKSENADVKKVNSIPADFPKNLKLFPLPQGPNDFEWNNKRKKIQQKQYIEPKMVGLSVIIPTFNRSNILAITLACLVNQKTNYPFEVIVADDGSQEDLVHIIRKYESLLDIKYVRQKDYGYQLCAVRNLGLRTAKYEFVSILDCDMAPNPKWVQSYIEYLLEDDDVALIGPRKYIDTHQFSDEQFLHSPELIENLPEIRTNNDVAGKSEGEISVDWRLEHFQKTDNLRLCDSPFRFFSGGNVAFSSKWLRKAGWFDEEFTHWGGEDNEFGYRLFREGCFFRSINGGMAYHQEPPGKENETDRAAGKQITINIVKEKVPYHYRKLSDISESKLFRVPLVSIYIPAYNCAGYIQRCVDSALNQTVTDLQVCICDDGSTDKTLSLVKQLYGNNPRVKIVSRENGGIAAASNTAVSIADGYYIGQLDSDDYLEPDAVELCLNEFLRDKSLVCVYTTNRNVNPNGTLIENGYNWSEFSREKLTTAMIVHHFRMFTIRAWKLTSGFDEKIENSIDYDIFLKLSEVGKFKHINKISYNRVLHGNNTSIKKLDLQKKNHFIAVNNSLRRQGIYSYSYDPKDDDKSSRKYQFTKTGEVDSLKTSVGNGGIAFSIIYPNEPLGIEKKIKNTLHYNSQTSVIVICINDDYFTPTLVDNINKLADENGIKILLNPRSYDTKIKYKQCELHLSNFNNLQNLGVTPEYIVLDTFDSMYVLPESINHMKKYDVGVNLGKISGYWESNILAHKSLQEICLSNLGISLENLHVKGMMHGMFMRYDISEKVFSFITNISEKCKLNEDNAVYPTDEVWFNLAILCVEKEMGTILRKTVALTYLPWDRKLCWNQQQILDAQSKIGIPKNKFLICSIDWEV